MLQLLDRLLIAAGALLTTGGAGGLVCVTTLQFFEPGFGGAPPAPLDYARASAWAAHPNKVDPADSTPAGYRDRQSESGADAFFIHGGRASGSAAFFAANLDPRDRKHGAYSQSKTERAMRSQASLFNCCARIFAPRYRLATPSHAGESFAVTGTPTTTGDGTTRRSPLDVAYADVRDAFRLYLKNENGGRPLILAGHGQGSRHALRLLREFYPQIRERLVVAYLLGAPVPRNAFSASPAAPLQPCDRDDRQTGCFVSFTIEAGSPEQARLKRATYAGVPAHCVNPLTWRADDHETGPAAWHKGALAAPDDSRSNSNGDSRRIRRGDRIQPAISDASCVNGRLLVQPAAARKYGPHSASGAEYGLFYLDLREDLQERLQRFSGNDRR